MSTHANQAKKSAPTGDAASKKNMGGANPTYKAHVQRNASTPSKPKEVARDSGERDTMAPPNPVAVTAEKSRTGAYGDGHYVPGK